MQQCNFVVQCELHRGFCLDMAYGGSRGDNPMSIGNTFQALDQLFSKYLSLGTALARQVPNPYFDLDRNGLLSAHAVFSAQLPCPDPEYASLYRLTSGCADDFYSSLRVKVQEQITGGENILAIFSEVRKQIRSACSGGTER